MEKLVIKSIILLYYTYNLFLNKNCIILGTLMCNHKHPQRDLAKWRCQNGGALLGQVKQERKKKIIRAKRMTKMFWSKASFLIRSERVFFYHSKIDIAFEIMTKMLRSKIFSDLTITENLRLMRNSLLWFFKTFQKYLTNAFFWANYFIFMLQAKDN